jgi:membrane protease YdiL (CAAX protease family)
MPAVSRLPDGRPTVSWRWWQAILVWIVTNVVIGQALVGGLLVAIFGLSITSGAANGAAIGLTVVVDLVWLAGMLFWLVRWHPGWPAALGFPAAGRRLREALIGYGLGLALYPAVAIVAGVVLVPLFQAFSDRSVSAPDQLETGLSVGAKIVAASLAIAVAPVAEELFFRGLLFRSIRDRAGFWPGAVLSSVLFGLSHYVAAPWQDAVLLQTIMVFTGLGLCAIYERRGNLVANIAAHMAFNTIGIVLILAA